MAEPSGDGSDAVARFVQRRQIRPVRLSAPTVVRPRTPLSRLGASRVRIKTIKVPKITAVPTKIGGKKDEGGGWLQNLINVPLSGLKAIGTGVAAIPSFVGKTAQTAVGFGEGIYDLALDAIDEDIYKSRFETDLDRARELGLEGDALIAYAAQRQYPLGSMFIESGVGTGRRLAEVGTAGRYDFGEPGIDYARAFREGNLGAVAVEDIGNLILGGRAVGAGNVVARAGGAIESTAPRLGRAISTTGRLIEEPIAETTRQTARLIGPRVTNARISSRFGRVAEAQRPIRVMMQQIGEEYRAERAAKIGELDTEIAGLIQERDNLLADNRTVDARVVQGKIDILNDKRMRRVEESGLVKRGRQLVKRIGIASDRAQQRTVQAFNRLSDYGAAPETPQVYRARATSLRDEAVRIQASDPVRARELNVAADGLDRIATMKEQSPADFDGPLPEVVSEAAVLFGVGKAHALEAMGNQGVGLDDLVRAASDPTVGPGLQTLGMIPTAEGVRRAIDYLRAKRGEQTTLTDVQIFQIDAMFAVLKQLSDVNTQMMREGRGMPEGPAPFTWFELFPNPEYLSDVLDLGGRQAEAVLDVLDASTLDFLNEAINEGVLDADALEEWGIDQRNPNGSWTKLVNEGAGTVAYRIAFDIAKLNFRRLMTVAPDIMMNENIYPASMRMAVITQKQALRRATQYDVQEVATELLRIEEQFGDMLPEGLITGIGNDLALALDPRRNITKAAFQQVVKRLESIRAWANEQRNMLESKETALTIEQNRTLDQIVDLEQALDAAESLAKTIASQPPVTSSRLSGVQADMLQAETQIEGLVAEREQLVAEEASLWDEYNAQVQPMLSQVGVGETRMTDNQRAERTIRQRINEVQSEISRIDADLALMGQATTNADALQRDFDLVVRLEGERDTATAARDARARAIDDAETEFHLLKGEMARLFSGFDHRKIKSRGDHIDPLTGKRINVETFAMEDVAAAFDYLPPAIRKKFKREHVSPDGEFVDELADEFANQERRTISTWEWLELVARTYKKLYDAQQRLNEARQSTRRYQEQLGEQDVLYDPELGELGETGLSSQQVMRAIEMTDPVTVNDTMARRRQLQQELNDFNAQLDTIMRERVRIAEELGIARGAVPMLRAPQSNPRIRAIDDEITNLRTTQRNNLRRLRFARQAEPKQATQEEARRLRGTPVVVRRPAAGGEGPSLGQVRPRVLRANEQERTSLNRQMDRRAARLQRIRQDLANQQLLEEEAATLDVDRLRRPEMVGEMPFGPELFREGEAPIYLPAGPTRRMTPTREYDVMYRGEGAAPQTRLQAAQQRVSSAVVLQPSQVAARIIEVLGQQYRNMAVEEIILDPQLTRRVNELLTEDELQAIRDEAVRRVTEQKIERNQYEFDRQVATEFGNEVMRRLSMLGYEIVTPQKFDPQTNTHAPLGTLDKTTRGSEVAENSVAMRIGVSQRLFQQFEPRGVRNVPALISRALDGIGNLTQRWKSVILPISLRWQIGDAVGIVLFSWVRGDIPPRQLISRIRQVIGQMTDPNDPRLGAILFGDVLDKAFADPSLAAAFGSELEARGLRTPDQQFLDRIAARVSGEQPSIGALRWFDAYRQRAFKFNQAINAIGRAAVFMENLQRLLEERGRTIDEINGTNSLGDTSIVQAVEQAVDATNETLGAFSDLSPWERQVFRNIFPFWSWIRFINKAAYELAADHPDRVLLAAHLGSMATDGEDNGLADWLAGKTPVLGTFVDLNFLNPYSDAILLTRNPFKDILETGTSVSPAIVYPLTVANELYYGGTGRNLPLMPQLSRPSYLEGRPGATTRGYGDVLGGIAYKGLTTFGGPVRNILDVLPTGEIPFTDIATGPVSRFGQGSLRTTGAFREPRLGPVAGRIGPALRSFGIPAPLIQQGLAERQAREQAQRDRAARLRRIEERKAAKR